MALQNKLDKPRPNLLLEMVVLPQGPLVLTVTEYMSNCGMCNLFCDLNKPLNFTKHALLRCCLLSID